MSISKLTSAVSTYLTTTRASTSSSQTEFAAVARQARDQSSASANAASSTAATGTAATATDTFTRRQQIYGIKPPVLTNAPDPDGRTGSYRRMVEGIDPRIPGNPGYADYYGLGGTAAVEEQAARNKNVAMGSLVAPGTLRA